MLVLETVGFDSFYFKIDPLSIKWLWAASFIVRDVRGLAIGDR
jgi:hypothetical protein